MEFWYEYCCVADAPRVEAIRQGRKNLNPFEQEYACCCEFDLTYDLLYVGWIDGYLTTYLPFESSLKKYTSIPAHTSRVLQALCLPSAGVVSVAKESIRIHSVGGAPLYTAKSKEENRSFTSIVPLDHTTILVGSSDGTLQVANLARSIYGGYLEPFRYDKLSHGVAALCGTSLGTIVCGGLDG